MDFINLLVLLVLSFSIIFVVIIVAADCDIVTLLCSHFGKKPSEYKGKVIWITGASSGIGEAIAKQLAKAGARLVLSARRKKELARVKRVCLHDSDLTDEDILVLSLDVTNLESHDPALKNLLKHFGKLDVLLSNAGQFQMAEFEDTGVEIINQIFETNVLSVVNMNRVVVKYFLKNGGGQVAVMSSMSGFIAVPLSSAYNASKHAIHGYFNTLRLETYKKNITVTLICPGVIRTPIKCITKGVTEDPSEELANIVLSTGFPIMSVERCAYLSLIAMANRLNESWMGKLPWIPSAYLQIYCPAVFQILYKLVGWRNTENLREQLRMRRRKCSVKTIIHS